MMCLIRGKDNHSTSTRTTYRNRRQWLSVRQRHRFGFTLLRSGYMHVEDVIVHVMHCHQGRICVILFDVTNDQVCSRDGVPRQTVARQRLIVQSQSVLLGAERRHTHKERERERERERFIVRLLPLMKGCRWEDICHLIVQLHVSQLCTWEKKTNELTTMRLRLQLEMQRIWIHL